MQPITPYLERYREQGGPAERIQVRKVPLTFGRASTVDHTLYSGPVSKEHAAIIRVGDHYAVRDLHSTNGTFVNGTRVVEQVLRDGDIIHLANIELRFHYLPAVDPIVPEDTDDGDIDATLSLSIGQPASLIRGAELLRELIRTEAVDTLYQPIVDLNSGEVIGFEALSRGTHPDLSNRPDVLLSLAEQCGMVVVLSQLFRRLAVVRSAALLPGPKLFLNVHAREVGDRRFIESLSALPARRATDRRIVIEIPESSVTDVKTVASYRDDLARIGFEFAYDDFGAGQARLIELTDVPPAYLKLDKALVHGVAAIPRQEMVRALTKVTETLGVRVIAECIETETIASLCQQLGCALGQGYLFCPPVPAGPVRPAAAGARPASNRHA